MTGRDRSGLFRSNTTKFSGVGGTSVMWLLLAALSPGVAAASVPTTPVVAAGPAVAVAQTPAVTEALTLLDLWIAEQVAYHQIPGLAIGIVRGDQLVWAKGYGLADLATAAPVTTTTPFRVGSVSKLFTATAVVQLRDAGKLRLDDPLVRHLPWFRINSPFADAPSITIEHLLTHSAGLPREGAFPYWTTHVFPSPEELRAALPGQTAVYPPGEKIKYSNLGIALAGEVVAAASGESWSNYVDRHILGPLGMNASSAAPGPELVAKLAKAYLRKQPDGSRREAVYYETGALAPAAAVVSTLEDLARFASFHLASGGSTTAETTPGAAHETVLAAASRRDMRRLRIIDPSWSSGRGLGFSLSRRNNRTLTSHGGWIGGHRADFLLDPARQLAVVALTNADDASPGMFTRKALDWVGDELADAATTGAVPKVADPGWQRFLGVYSDPWGWEYQVLILDGGLVLYEHGYPPEDDPSDGISRLEPVSERVFRMGDGESLEFELDGDGNVTRIRRRYEYLERVVPPPRGQSQR